MSNISFCKDCKNWEYEYSCDLGMWGTCCSDKLKYDVDKNNMTYPIDAEFYYAQIKTFETFGCVCFESKQEVTQV